MSLLEQQTARIRRARRLQRHAERAHTIGDTHSRAIALGPDMADHYGTASRAFALARRLYERARCTLLGAS